MGRIVRIGLMCWLATALSVALSGCGYVVIHSTRVLYLDYQQQNLDVNAALARYRAHVLQMEATDAAEMFDADAELSHGEQAPVVGRQAILGRFNAVADHRVVEYDLAATRTNLIRDGALQKGTYRQKLVTPTGEVVVAQGVFEARWSHEPGRPWLIARLHTSPDTGS